MTWKELKGYVARHGIEDSDEIISLLIVGGKFKWFNPAPKMDFKPAPKPDIKAELEEIAQA